MLKDALDFFLLRETGGRVFQYDRRTVRILLVVIFVCPAAAMWFTEGSALAYCLKAMQERGEVLEGHPVGVGLVCLVGDAALLALLSGVFIGFVYLKACMLTRLVSRHPLWNPGISLRNAMLSSLFMSACVSQFCLVAGELWRFEALGSLPLSPGFMGYCATVQQVGMWRVIRRIGPRRAAFTLLASHVMIVAITIVPLFLIAGTLFSRTVGAG